VCDAHAVLRCDAMRCGCDERSDAVALQVSRWRARCTRWCACSSRPLGGPPPRRGPSREAAAALRVIARARRCCCAAHTRSRRWLRACARRLSCTLRAGCRAARAETLRQKYKWICGNTAKPAMPRGRHTPSCAAGAQRQLVRVGESVAMSMLSVNKAVVMRIVAQSAHAHATARCAEPRLLCNTEGAGLPHQQQTITRRRRRHRYCCCRAPAWWPPAAPQWRAAAWAWPGALRRPRPWPPPAPLARQRP
jgi:hypothetical protein